MPFSTVGIGEIPFGDVVRWSPVFSATNLEFTGTNSTYPTYNSYYVKNGHIVSFWIQVDMTTVTNFGTGQYKVELPFAPITGAMNHFLGWVWRDPSVPADQLDGHIQILADHLPNNGITLDLHWLGETTPEPKPTVEHIFKQGSPITLTTVSKVYINGTYICKDM